MPRQIQKWLVIDASIGGTAGKGNAEIGTPKEKCRLCLRTILANSYGAVFHPQTWEEWQRHKSEYSRQWLTDMYSRKKLRNIAAEAIVDTGLRTRLEKLVGTKIGQEEMSGAIFEIMLKDCHLLETALDKSAGKIVLSLDDSVRFHFKMVSIQIKDIRSIVWVNPGQPEDGAIAWLEAGAEPETHRMLGS